MAVLAVAVTSGMVFVYHLVRTRRRKTKEARELMEMGNQQLREKMYSEAIVSYLRWLSMAETRDEELMNVYNSMVVCFAKIKAYREALVYVDKSLGIDVLGNEKALRWRYECHKILEMRRETLCDAFLCGLVTKDERYRKIAQEILKSEAEAEARRRFGTSGGEPSDIVYESFFATFPGLLEKPFVEDEGVRLVVQKEYSKALEVGESKSGAISIFVTAAINHVRGKDMLAISLLEHEKMVFSICLREYLKSLHGQGVMDLEDFINKNSSNVTVLFYAAKIYFNLKKFDLYERFMDLAVRRGDHDFLYVDKISCYISRNKCSELQETVEAALEKYPESISVLSAACEYYLRNEDFGRVGEMLSVMGRTSGRDPRPFLFRGILAQCRGDLEEAERYLRYCIELDRRYFRPYVYLGGILLGRNDKGSREVYEKALGCAVTYEEIFSAQQALILLDVQDKIVEIYPDVLKAL